MNEEGDGMKRIFFNSLKGRLREYVTVLVCGIFTIAVLFWSNAAGDCLYQLMPSEYAENLESVVVFLSFIVTYELLFFLLVLVLLSYIRKRSYDYALLTIMGMKKKHRRLFIGGEYAGIAVGSLTGGILLGMVLAAVSKYVLSIYIRLCRKHFLRRICVPDNNSGGSPDFFHTVYRI